MTKSSGSEIPNSLAALFCLSERGEKNCQFVLILPGRNSVHLRLFRMQGKQKTATATGCADVNVAEKNHVFYYPILVRHEKESWSEFRDQAVDKLVDGTYGGDYQHQKIDAFMENLK